MRHASVRHVPHFSAYLHSNRWGFSRESGFEQSWVLLEFTASNLTEQGYNDRDTVCTEKKSGAKTATPWSRFAEQCHYGG